MGLIATVFKIAFISADPQLSLIVSFNLSGSKIAFITLMYTYNMWCSG